MGRFNCFCTAELLQGRRQSYRWIEWMHERGHRGDPVAAQTDDVRVILFQLCGRHLTSAEPTKVAPLHEGFLLGASAQEHIVLEKPAHRPLRTNHWSTMMAEWTAESTVQLTHANWQDVSHLLR
jgi:hypothetical protein